MIYSAPHTPPALLDSPNFNLCLPGGISVLCSVCSFLCCNPERFSSQKAGWSWGSPYLYFFTPGSQSCAICSSMSKHSSIINYTQFPRCLWQEDKSSISYSLWLNSYYFLNVFRICWDISFSFLILVFNTLSLFSWWFCWGFINLIVFSKNWLLVLLIFSKLFHYFLFLSLSSLPFLF